MHRALFVSVVTVFSAAQLAAANPPQVALSRSAGLTISGVPSSIYAIQCTSNLGPAAAWKCLDFIRLTNSNAPVPKTVPASGRSCFYRGLEITTPSNMVFVAPARFTLGSPSTETGRYSDEGPLTQVTFTRGLFVSRNLVTQAEYSSIIGSNPSYFTGIPTRPVDNVSWEDATNYCDRLTQHEIAAGRIPLGSAFRLPTEAEWEFLCRAGTTNRFFFGDDPAETLIVNYAWTTDNSGDTTHPVGLKLPNALGLYDMSGNLWEWCSSWYDAYPGGSVTDYEGPATGAGRVLRGGSWADGASLCRSACRILDDQTSAFSTYGFRVVLAPAP